MKALSLKSILAASAALTIASGANATVVYGSFNLTAYDNAIDLTWNTLDEMQNEYFIVQRSFNGTDWFDIGTLPGSGTTFGVEMFYYFQDAQPLPGNNYYTLVSVDSMGNQERTAGVVNHSYNTMTVCDFVVYPNPADTYLLLYWENCPATQWMVRIVSSSGFSMMAQPADNAQFLQLDVSNFPTGMYTVIAHQRGSKSTLKKQVYIN